MDNLIRANELRSYLNDEVTPTIIDVRAPEAYEKGHLPGAINIPAEQIIGAMGQIPMDHPIVTYCNYAQPRQFRKRKRGRNFKRGRAARSRAARRIPGMGGNGLSG